MISRLNQVKHIESLVHEACRRGLPAVLLLDQRTVKGHHELGDEKACVEAHQIPSRLLAVVGGVWPFDSLLRLERIVSVQGLDVLLVVGELAGRWRPASRPLVCLIQTSWSSIMALDDPRRWDVIYGWSDVWRQWWRTRPSCRATNPIELDRRFVSAGSTLCDLAHGVDRSVVQSRYGLHGRALVFLPFPFQSVKRTAWTHGVYRWPWPLGVLAAPLGPPQSLHDAIIGLNDRAVVKALRSYCDRHSAALVVKSRPKTPVPRYLAERANVVVEGDGLGEPTLLDLLSASDIMVHFYSMAVVEAAAVGVPWLCISLSPARWSPYADRAVVDGVPTVPWGGLFAWGSYGRAWSPERIVGSLADQPWPVTGAYASERQDYVKAFLGGEPFRAASRIVDDLAARV